MNDIRWVRLLPLLLLLARTGWAAQPPGVLQHQGFIQSAGIPFSGTGSFKFALVDGAGTTTYWSNDGTSVNGQAPTAGVSVPVSQGRYAVSLGDTSLANMTAAISASVFADQSDVRLRVWFNDGVNGWQQLAPDPRIVSVGYALSAAQAQEAQGVPAGAINSAMLANFAVTKSKLADGAVDFGKLASGAVKTTTLANGAVTSAKLAAGAALVEILDDDGAGSGLDADLLDGKEAAAFWQLGGNAGTTPGTEFLGTTDNQPLEFKVNGQRVLRLQPPPGLDPWSAPNVIGGFRSNRVAGMTSGATIAGGGTGLTWNNSGEEVPAENRVESDFGTVGGGMANTAGANAVVGGGTHNTASGRGSAVSGGEHNTASGRGSAVSGGDNNHASGESSTVGGGIFNQASGDHATVSGGMYGSTTGSFSTVPGGALNRAGGDFSFAAGRRANANHPGAFVWADSTDADFASTGNNQFLIRASGGVGINQPNPSSALDVAGTVTAAAFAGDGSGLTGVVPADAAVTTDKLAPGAVTSTHIAAGTVLPARQIADTAYVQTGVPNTSYVATSASLTGIDLPNTTAQVGDIIQITGAGAGGWTATLYQPDVWTVRESNRSWYSVASSADGGKLVAVVNGGPIYTSTDSGVTWMARASNRSWWSVASSADGSKLVAVVSGGLIYTSTDSGVSWTPRMTDANRSWLSVASSADGINLVAVVFNGQVWTSRDSGETWTQRLTGTNRQWGSVASSADGSKLVAVVLGGRIYTSTDYGTNWTARGSNGNWRSVASSADGSKLVAAVDSGGQIWTSTDSGTNWTLQANSPSASWRSVASSADGSKLVAVGSSQRIYTSTDSGVNWTARDSSRNWLSAASSADGNMLVAVVNSGRIYTSGTTVASGAQGTTATLQYLDGGQWAVHRAANGTVTSAQLADGAVGAAQITTGAVTTDKLAPGAVGAAQLAPNLGVWERSGGSISYGQSEGSFSLHPYLQPFNGTSLLGSLRAENGNGPQLRFEGSAGGFIDIGQRIDGSFVVENTGDTAVLTVAQSGDVAIAGTLSAAAFAGNGPLEFKVNGQRGLRLEPTLEDGSHAGIVNVVGGSPANAVGPGVYGATIGGGGAVNLGESPYPNRVDSDFGTIAGGGGNTIQADAGFSTIGGGNQNTIQTEASFSTIGGGYLNTIKTEAYLSAIGGGERNTIQTEASFSTIGGGYGNTIQTNADVSTIGGGYGNTIQTNALYATIPGGRENRVGTDADYSFAAGRRAQANHPGAFVWADSTDADFASTGTNQFLIRAAGGVGINQPNPSSALDVLGTVTATAFAGDGSALTGVVIAAGTVVPAQSITGTTRTAVANTSYTATSASFTGIDLPITNAQVGDIVQITGAGAGGWAATLYQPDVWTARASGGTWYSVASSADGTRLVAGENDGQIHTSTDSGVTWTSRLAGGSYWISVASSADGKRLVAVDQGPDVPEFDGTPEGGRIYTSGDYGANWTARDQNRAWSSVASSADGSRLVAVEYWVCCDVPGRIYTSTDYGTTWTARGSNDKWRSVASSADGSKLVAVVNDGPIYTSTDSGVTWTARASNRSWRSVASSADGSKLVAVVLGGQIYTSTDSGVTWTPRGEDNLHRWAGVASSADGNKLVALDEGHRIYTSGITVASGAQGTTATLQYQGSGQWGALQNAGGILVSPSGAVGIGTTSPTIPVANARLRVAGGHVVVDNNYGLLAANSSGTGIGAGIDGTPTDDLDVWAGGSVAMSIKAVGGNVLIGPSSYTPATVRRLNVDGSIGANAFVTTSDRNLKENFESVDALGVLEKVNHLPITRWNFKESPGVRHLGPTAQDFRAAFGLGDTDTGITTVDADGVALAAIQGLNQKLEAKAEALERENGELRTTVESLAARLAALEARLEGSVATAK